jgi:hypothetical protein
MTAVNQGVAIAETRIKSELMKLRPYLPLIILLVLSCIILVGAPGYFLVDAFNSEYPKEVSTKISLSLKQGLGVAAFSLVLIWIGAGVDFGISRVKQKAVRVGLSIIGYLGPLLLCGLLTGAILFTVGSFSFPPAWHRLPDAPPGAAQIIAMGEDSLAIQTESGEAYFCGTAAGAQCWQALSAPPPPIYQNENFSVSEIEDAPATKLKGNALSLRGVKFPTPGGYMHVHYALLDNGSVWVLRQTVIAKEDSGFGAGLLLTLIILPGLIALVGIYFGAAFNAIVRWFINRLPPPAASKVEDEPAK